MEDYIDPWIGLWISIFLWGFWFYLVVKTARQKRYKITIDEDEFGFKHVEVFVQEKSSWRLVSSTSLMPEQDVQAHVKKVMDTV